MNAPYVDNSYKWAGGGFLSTVGDLLQFGNAMLYSLQFKPSFQNINIQDDLPESDRNIKNMDTNISNNLSVQEKNIVLHKSNLPGYLSSKTVKSMWAPVTDAKEEKYGMGWFVSPDVNECMFCENKKFCVYHTGGAIGASSVLLIVPQNSNAGNDVEQTEVPKGTVVTILTNLQSVGLTKAALKIAKLFDVELAQ